MGALKNKVCRRKKGRFVNCKEIEAVESDGNIMFEANKTVYAIPLYKDGTPDMDNWTISEKRR